VLRGAFIGFGAVAEHGHLPGWQACEDVRIVAATDVAASRRGAFMAACPLGRWFENVEHLFSSETLDFVDICTPPATHAGLIRQALSADLHVLCEKPLLTETADAERIAAACARAGRIVHTVHNWLNAPACRSISALIDKGEIGSPRSINWQTLRTGPAAGIGSQNETNWRLDPAMAGGGILLDHGWHALYCILRWAGAPRAVAARLENRRFTQWPIEDTATVALDMSSATAHIHLTWASEQRSNRIEIGGDHGCIIVENERLLLKSGAGEHEWSCTPSLSEGSHHQDWFMGVAQEFLAAVTAAGKDNLNDALLCARLIDLAKRSSRQGGAHLVVDD
jgi:predicted dehydrogenase